MSHPHSRRKNGEEDCEEGGHEEEGCEEAVTTRDRTGVALDYGHPQLLPRARHEGLDNEFTTSRKPLGDLVVPKRKTRRSGDHEGQAANDRVRSAVRSDAHPTPEKGGISMAKKAAKKTAKKAAKKR